MKPAAGVAPLVSPASRVALLVCALRLSNFESPQRLMWRRILCSCATCLCVLSLKSKETHANPRDAFHPYSAYAVLRFHVCQGAQSCVELTRDSHNETGNETVLPFKIKALNAHPRVPMSDLMEAEEE